jgi:hypothetical protein
MPRAAPLGKPGGKAPGAPPSAEAEDTPIDGRGSPGHAELVALACQFNARR